MVKHTEPTLTQGLRVGPYQIDRLAAQTRLSRIAQATHIETGDSVALKIPTGPNGRKLLVNELAIYRSLAGLRHVVGMHGAGFWEGNPYLATQWQPNGTLRQMLPTPPETTNYSEVKSLPSNPQTFLRNLKILADSAMGLTELHEKARIVHCDIKPANIAVGSDGTGKLLDFGVALPVNDTPYEGTVSGTPGQSIPPEVYRDGTQASSARDAWAIAATALQALSGVKPFGEPPITDPLECYHQVNRKPPLTLRGLQPDAPSDLDRVITEALDPDPTKRPSTGEIRDVFNQVINQAQP